LTLGEPSAPRQPVGTLLDDEASLRAADPSGLLDAYLSISARLTEGYTNVRGRIARSPVRSVTFCAMGGSAAAGDVIVSAYRDRTKVPMGTARGYRLPSWCDGPESLVVCVSYSGNTEETLATYGEAHARGCFVVAICSGGELEERAALTQTPLLMVEPGAPQPRAALGYLTGAALRAVEDVALISSAEEDVRRSAENLSSVAERLAPGIDSIRNPAKSIVSWLGDRIPVVWGSEGVSQVAAFRWKTAFNENAKIPAFASALPELDHHEVEGWSDGWGGGFRLVVLRSEDEHESVGPRIQATLEAIDGSGLETREVHAPAGPPLAAALTLMMLGDSASAYHALARGIDPAPIDAIARVKSRLADRQ
jgi:glucose/mannose-6-phosphate isomerase